MGPLPLANAKKHHTLLAAVLARLATAVEVSCPTRSSQNTNPELEDAPSDLRHRLACPICLAELHTSQLSYDAKHHPSRQYRRRCKYCRLIVLGFCHRAPGAHPSCLTGHRLRTSCWIHSWTSHVPSFFPPAAPGGFQMLSILSFFMPPLDMTPSCSAACGDSFQFSGGTRNQRAANGQWVCTHCPEARTKRW